MNSPITLSPADRRRAIARVHAVASELGWDEAQRRAFLKRITGKTSLADLTDDELARVVTHLQPTTKQWSELSRLCRGHGFSGFEDPGFQVFMTRTTKLADPSHLTRSTASRLILGLQRWLEHRRARADAVPRSLAPDASRTRPNENASVRDHRGVDLGTATGVEWTPSREARQGHPA